MQREQVRRDIHGHGHVGLRRNKGDEKHKSVGEEYGRVHHLCRRGRDRIVRRRVHSSRGDGVRAQADHVVCSARAHKKICVEVITEDTMVLLSFFLMLLVTSFLSIEICRKLIVGGLGSPDSVYTAENDYRGRPDFFREDQLYNLHGEISQDETTYWQIDNIIPSPSFRTTTRRTTRTTL